jgi:chromosome segregation ATPase
VIRIKIPCKSGIRILKQHSVVFLAFIHPNPILPFFEVLCKKPQFEKQSTLLDQRLQALQEECKGKLNVAQYQIEAQSKEIFDLRNMKGDAEKRAAVAEAHAEDRANQIALLLGQIEDLKEEKSGLRSMLDSALKDRNEAEEKAATLEIRLKEKR